MSTTAPAEDPPLPPPLEWHKDTVAVDEEGWICIKNSGDDHTTRLLENTLQTVLNVANASLLPKLPSPSGQ